jgi:periplasmic divalent cation tolerance protein
MPKRKADSTIKSQSKRLSKNSRYLVVLTTCGTRREANHIARALVTERLAACVNITGKPVSSIYRWKGKIEQAEEFSLLIKTTERRLAPLQSALKRLHSYKVPEFLVLPVVTGSPAYLAWIDDCLRI